MKIEDVIERRGDSIVFLKPYGRIHIPETFFDKKLAIFIERKIEMMGVFNLYVWDDYDFEEGSNKKPEVFAFQIPTRIILTPNNRKEEVIDGVRNSILEFMQNDIMVESVKIIQDVKNVESAMNLLFNNFIPESMDYADIMNCIENSAELNNINLKTTSVNLEMIVTKMCKNPDNLSLDFRTVLAKNPKTNQKLFKIIRLADASKYENAFSAITSGNPMLGIVKSISDTRKGRIPRPSPVEDSIK